MKLRNGCSLINGLNEWYKQDEIDKSLFDEDAVVFNKRSSATYVKDSHDRAFSIGSPQICRAFPSESTQFIKCYATKRGGEQVKELYRTDVLRQVRPENDTISMRNDERRFIPINDRWRESWSNGVQVPVHEKYPPCIVEARRGRSTNISLRSAFHMSDKLLYTHPKRYVGSGHRKVNVPKFFNYLLDEMDVIFLEKLNNRRENAGLCSISNDHFIKIMSELEITCHKNMYREILPAVLSPVSSLGTNDFEHDTCCDICGQTYSEEEDKIIFCDGCNIGVHQSCYGLDAIPTNDWRCLTCDLLGYEARPRCVFCPLLDGAMKCTGNSDTWAHVACALWLPEVRFADIEHRDCISNAENIPEKRRLRCSVCGLKQGACIQCSIKTCTDVFHVSCALRNSQVMRIESMKEPTPQQVRMISLCTTHSSCSSYNDCDIRPTGEFTVEKSTEQSDRWKCAMRNFFFYIDPPYQIAQNLGIAEEIIHEIFEYWKLKRIDHGSRPLMSCRSGIELQVLSDLYKKFPTSVASQRMENMVSLRCNLEQARNLLYMITKREKLKKSSFLQLRDVYKFYIKNIASRNSKEIDPFMKTCGYLSAFKDVDSVSALAKLDESVPTNKASKSRSNAIRERNGQDLTHRRHQPIERTRHETFSMFKQ